MKGAHDWIFLFDGRNRDSAHMLHGMMKGRSHMAELMLLFNPGAGRSEVGRTRKVALGASNVERLLLYSPIAKTALAAKPRTNFNSLGETSTHDTTYSGVPFRSRRSIPRISEADKAGIMGAGFAGVPEQLLQSFPNPVLFWQEAKPIEIYEQILTDFDIRCVFDVSPASGALAEAALRLGICYVGVTTKATHAKWLNNVLDNVALAHMATPGRPCYAKDSADEIQTHFADILVGLEEAAAAEDLDMEQIMS